MIISPGHAKKEPSRLQVFYLVCPLVSELVPFLPVKWIVVLMRLHSL